MNPRIIPIAAGCLALTLVGAAGRSKPPKLPEKADNYANPDLPAHFKARPVRDRDNTPSTNPTTDAGATLGRVLFHDTRLSAEGSQSCASCHSQKNAFAEPNRFSKGIHGDVGDRNAMGLVNARFTGSGRFFWDERAATLEAQVLQPIANPREMAHDVDLAVASIKAEPFYGPLFTKAFGDPEVTRTRVAKALAQFVRSMVSYRSKFDDGLTSAGSIDHDFDNFSASENLGKSIFLRDRARGCASCHLRGQALFQGDRPTNNGLDAEFTGQDNGVGDLSLFPPDYGRFKAPDLRNVELTAPYMHDGRFATLEQVVEHYNSGLKPHPNLDPRLREGRGGAPRKLGLDDRQKAGLVDFLKTLTDRSFVEDPKFSDPFTD